MIRHDAGRGHSLAARCPLAVSVVAAADARLGRAASTIPAFSGAATGPSVMGTGEFSIATVMTVLSEVVSRETGQPTPPPCSVKTPAAQRSGQPRPCASAILALLSSPRSTAVSQSMSSHPRQPPPDSPAPVPGHNADDHGPGFDPTVTDPKDLGMAGAEPAKHTLGLLEFLLRPVTLEREDRPAGPGEAQGPTGESAQRCHRAGGHNVS